MGEPADEPLRVAVRVRPRASRASVGGSYRDGELVVAVREPAVDGRATEAVARALAGAFGLTRSRVDLVSGASSRTKIFALDGDRAELSARLRVLLSG